MTAATDATHELTLHDATVATAAQPAAHDQADAAAHDRAANDATSAAKQARSQVRAMKAAWASLALGLVLSLGIFSAIAWENSVAANGPSHSVSTPAP